MMSSPVVHLNDGEPATPKFRDLYTQHMISRREAPLRAPLHEQLREEFRRRISTGAWPDGSQVPSEATLCEEFKTSRGPVRQALAALRAEQLIVGGRGRAPVVHRDALSQPVETFLSFTEWATGLGKEPGQRTIEIAKRTASPVVAAQLGLADDVQVVSLLRLRLLDGEPTMVERSHFVLEAGQPLFGFDTDSGSTFRFLVEHGVDLHSARHTIDAVAADETDAELLGIPAGSPLLRERRVTSSSKGEALEYAEDRYRPELANFVVHNTLNQRAPLARVLTPGNPGETE